jgi:PHD/YefM family antitoxin component YafN of YafNO toxin-antitoxin module
MVYEVIVDDKKYVLLPKEEYESLKIKVELHSDKNSLLSLDEAEAYSLELSNKWAKEKSQFVVK